MPNGMKEFGEKVIQTINGFGDEDGITYSLLGGGIDDTSGNCNTSSSTILIKSGVDEKDMKSLESNIQGIHTGFKTSRPKPWTKEEQKKSFGIKSASNQQFTVAIII